MTQDDKIWRRLGRYEDTNFGPTDIFICGNRIKLSGPKRSVAYFSLAGTLRSGEAGYPNWIAICSLILNDGWYKLRERVREYQKRVADE